MYVNSPAKISWRAIIELMNGCRVSGVLAHRNDTMPAGMRNVATNIQRIHPSTVLLPNAGAANSIAGIIKT
jgi:hypothetical protein